MAYNDSQYLAAGRGGMFNATSTDQQFSPYSNNYFNQPGWHVGSQYITPSYTANMRPSYGGPIGESNPWQTAPSYGSSLWGAAGAIPLPGTGMGVESPLHQNAMATDQYHAHNLVATPVDRTMDVAQKYALPIAAYYAANRVSSMGSFAMGGGAGRAFTSVTGLAAPKMGLGAATGNWIGRGVGSGVGRLAGGAVGALTGFGGGAAGAAMGAGVAGAVGAAAGLVAWPILLGMGISKTIDAAVFQPYVNTRRVAEATMSNFHNRYVGGEGGNAAGGLGMSSKAAYSIASGVQHAGWKDFGLSQKDYTAMADYGMQAGMYDDMQLNSKDVVKRTKKMASDVKKIMTVFGERDMQEAVGILKKFMDMGATPGSYETSSAMSSLKMGSAITGKSASELLNTVGAQGQYLYQSMGMSGVAGVINSTNAYSGMVQANKMGIVSTRMLSLLGGAEGAAQNVIQAKVGLQGSDYNKMMLYNQFMGGGTGNSIEGNINKFAQTIGGDPIKAMGQMILHGADMQNAQAIGGQGSEYLQIIQQAQLISGGRKVDANTIAAVAKGMGLSDTQVKSALIDMKRMQGGGDWGLQKAVNKDLSIQKMDSEGWGWTSRFTAPLRKGAYDAMDGMQVPIDVITGAMAGVSDSINRGWTNFKYGKIDPSKSNSLNNDYQVLLGQKKTGAVDVLDIDGLKDESSAVAKMINEAAMGGGNVEARELASKIVATGGSKAELSKLNTLMGGRVDNTQMFNFSQSMKKNQIKKKKAEVQDVTLRGLLNDVDTRSTLLGRGFHKGEDSSPDDIRRREGQYMGVLNLMTQGADAGRIAEYLDALPEEDRLAVIRMTGSMGKQYLLDVDGSINTKKLQRAMDTGLTDTIQKASKTAGGLQLIALNEVGEDNSVLSEEGKAKLGASSGIMALNGMPGNDQSSVTDIGETIRSARSTTMASQVSRDIDLDGATSLYGDGEDAGPRMIHAAAGMMLKAAELQVTVAGKDIDKVYESINEQNRKLAGGNKGAPK